MIKINLLPKEIQDKGKGVEWVILGGALIGLFMLIGMASYFLKLQNYKKDLTKRDRWSQQLSEVKAKVAEVEKLDADKVRLKAKKDIVLQLLQGRLFYPKLMEIFYGTLPPDIWITNLKLTEDAQKNVTIAANSNSLSTEGIADWLETLESKPEKFSGVNLSAIEVLPPSDPKQSPTFKFTLTFVCRPPPPDGA